ncbi:ThuA domain-containing protein [Demequina aurantiaca]|uniref:ThuA domain-containing protein n=1 Tax=Demequina aurantiaca TaxID=676200 RepID=UPI000781DF30|nr:ThuA domain-containing protein [Demequina aurantiaca]
MLPLAVLATAPAQAATIPASGLDAAAFELGAVAPLAVGEEEPEFKALVFSKTAGYTHTSIPTAIAAIEQMGEDEGFEVDSTDDAGAFTAENLEQYDVVVWVSTTGDVLDTTQQEAFEGYIQGGGGYAGIHAASDTEYDWPWYGDLVGAYFKGHPAQQNADVIVEDHAHPSTEHLPEVWTRFDEWYSFQDNPRSDVHVLASVDESSYTGGTMGDDHPIAWCHNYDGGRSWYTGGGHTDASYSDPAFATHLLQGIRTAAGVEKAGCNVTQSDSYELVTLDGDTGNPMSLNVADDGTVFYLERKGTVRRIDAGTQQRTDALVLPVALSGEDGLLGMVLDPEFETNNWAYIYYAPLTPTAEDGPHNRISRFTYDPAAGTFDAESEIAVLKITTQRDECCHAGGDMVFDLDGNLILATGDNTNPFNSSGYTPIDERAGRSSWDAQGTSGNTNDLRGKIVRITPQADGSYTIPAGNLFDETDDADDKTRPEVYAMGFRNPFRIGLDPYTGSVLVADYGPDAGSRNANRGPAATTEWNIVSEAGNYGWPFCTGITCYNDFNFENNQSGSVFNAAAITNDSPNNTGLTTLPPVISPEYYGERGRNDNPWPQVGNGSGYTGAPMGGPVYEYDKDLDVDTKFPEYWDGKAFFGDWNTGEAFSIQMNREGAQPGTEIMKMVPMLPGVIGDESGFNRVMDAEWGPDGSLYVIDWGSGFGGNNGNSGVFRIDYVEGNPSPIARAAADVTHTADESLEVNFSSEGTRHPAALPLDFEWDFGDGSATSSELNPTHTYNGVGEYTAQLTVTDPDGRFAIATVNLVVGNALPTVSIVFPEQGGFFSWGDEVSYKVIVDDPDASGAIDCANVQVLPALGHDSHQHPMSELNGCEGKIPTQRDSGHGLTANIFWVVDVRYTDDGGAAGVPLTAYGTNVLNSKHFEAEYFDETGGDSEGVRTEDTEDEGGGLNLSYVGAGDWWSYEPVNFKGITGIEMRGASPNKPGTITMHWNAPDGPVLGTFTYTNTGGWQKYQDFGTELTDLPTETGTLYFVNSGGEVNINYFEWTGVGVDSNQLPVIDLDVPVVSGDAPLTVDATATATDPEGTAVTLTWNQGTGAGFVAGDATEQFVYDTPGQYLLRVRATDEEGAYGEEEVTINVTQAGGNTGTHMCFSGRSDDFLDDTLDTDRWDGIVRANQDATVKDGSLVIPAGKTDIYKETNNVENIVLQDVPAGAWSATTKVTFPARDKYQQAGLVIYGDDDNYAKMVLQARGADNAGQRIFQFVREEAGAPNEVAASNTANLGAEFPDTYFVRLTSDGTSLNGWYSEDGVDFTMMPETKLLAGIDNPRIGVAAWANAAAPITLVEAEFDWFHITPDDTASAVGGPDDEFDGSALNTCIWTVVNEDTDGYRVADGELQIDTTPYDIYESAAGDVTNFVVQDVEGDEWVVETKVDASGLDRRYQQGGLIVRADDDNYVKLDILATNAAGSTLNRNIEMRSEVGGAVQQPQPTVNGFSGDIVSLRLERSGDDFTGYYSVDGESWTQVGSVAITNAAAATGEVGLYALGNPAQGSQINTAHFDYFRVIEDTVVEPLEVSAAVSPEDPSGANGWYNGDVTVEIDVTGGGESSVYREWLLEGTHVWSEYTAPIVVSEDGEHTIYFKASSPEADEVEGEVSFKIDATKPSVTGAVADLEADPRVFEATATDAGSGVELTEYRIDAGAWTEYTEGVELTDAAQTIEFRATDAAGNLSAVGSAAVPAVEGEVEVAAPVLTKVAPTSGTTAGGTTVTLTGTDFTGATSVKFDGKAGTSLSVVSSTKITVKTPAHAAGSANVVVTTAAGVSAGKSFTYVAPVASKSFADVTTSTKFYKEILWLANEGVSTGWDTPAGKEYRPLVSVERNAMVAFMYRYAGSPAVTLPAKSPFADITPSTKFYKEMVWASQQGISTGWLEKNGTKTFRPYEAITRDAMAAFLYRMAGKPSHTSPALSPFVDMTPASKFYKEITWLADTGITTGWGVSGGKEYRPFSFTNRDAMAAFLYRFDRLGN